MSVLIVRCNVKVGGDVQRLLRDADVCSPHWITTKKDTVLYVPLRDGADRGEVAALFVGSSSASDVNIVEGHKNDNGELSLVEDGQTIEFLKRKGGLGGKVQKAAWIDRVLRHVKSIDTVKDLALSTQADILSVVPRKWERLGDVVIVKMSGHAPAEEKAPLADEQVNLERRRRQAVGEALASVLRARCVAFELRPIGGELREPTIEVAFPVTLNDDAVDMDTQVEAADINVEHADASTSPTVTTHVENGIKYRFDAALSMFSSGNGTERMHVALEVIEGDTVVDMFAGIGYFSLPIAARSPARHVYAIEKNPNSFAFLLSNAILNRVQAKLTCVCGDNRVRGDELRGVATRVLMGYIPTPRSFIKRAVEFLARPHGGVILYHYVCKKSERELMPKEHFESECGNIDGVTVNVEIQSTRLVKSYAPKLYHYVAVVRVWFDTPTPPSLRDILQAQSIEKRQETLSTHLSEFDADKIANVYALKHSIDDRSRAGRIDEDIVSLCEAINSRRDFYTTSSCAGRLILVQTVPSAHSKYNVDWLSVTHDATCTFEEFFKDSLSQLRAEPGAEVWFKMEAPIVAVRARTLAHAQQMLDVCKRRAGLKRSYCVRLGHLVDSTDEENDHGKTGGGDARPPTRLDPSKVMLSIGDTQKIETLVALSGECLLDDKYCRHMFEVGMRKLTKSRARMQTYEEEIVRSLVAGDFAQKN